ncbi:MAG: hypothetical protein ACYCPQ_05915 [Elusimicrobiota bacterium]
MQRIWRRRFLIFLAVALAPVGLQRRARALSDSDKKLLSQYHYQIRPDGSVWADGAPSALMASEIPFVIERLKGAQRLETLLQVNMILGQAGGRANLSPDQLAKIQDIVRTNWMFLNGSSRRDLQGYLSPEDLAAVENEAAFQEAPAPAQSQTAQTPVLKSSATIAAPAPNPAPPPAPPQVTIVGAPMKAQQEMAAMLSGRVSPVPGAFPIGYHIFSLPLPPAPKPVAADELERFLAQAPYSQDVIYLLRLISENAGLGRNRALRFLLAQIPDIVIAPRRCKSESRGCVEASRTAVGDTRYAVVLVPGPLIVERGILWFHRTFLLPDAAAFYADRGIPAPNLAAARTDAISGSEENGRWGKTIVYADGSRRGSYSRREEAGVLLGKLLEADAESEGWDAAPYDETVYVKVSEDIFFNAEVSAAKTDGFLDPLARSMYRRWKNNPAALRDEIIHELAATRSGIADFLGKRWALSTDELSDPSGCEIRFSQSGMDERAALRAAHEKDAAVLEDAGIISSGILRSSGEAEKKAARDFRPKPMPVDECLRAQQKKEMGRRLALNLAGRAFSAESAWLGARKK